MAGGKSMNKKTLQYRGHRNSSQKNRLNRNSSQDILGMNTDDWIKFSLQVEDNHLDNYIEHG